MTRPGITARRWRVPTRASAGAAAVALALGGLWSAVALPAGAAGSPTPVAETVAVTWTPRDLGRLSLAHGSTALTLTLRSAAGDAPIAVTGLAVEAPGLPAQIYLSKTSFVLSPGTPVSVRATVAATSTSKAVALPADGRLVLTGNLHTQTVSTTLSDRVLFATGQWQLAGGAQQALGSLLHDVQRFAGQVTTLQVTGYADSQPDAAIGNKTLSLYRARSVASWLEQRGVRAGVVRTVGAGATDFVASNATPAGRERNRRVRVDIALSKAAQPVFVGASHPVEVVSLPVPHASATPHRAVKASGVGAGALAGVVVAVLLLGGLLAGVAVVRRRRGAPAPPSWVSRLPRWDRRRVEVERQVRR